VGGLVFWENGGVACGVGPLEWGVLRGLGGWFLCVILEGGVWVLWFCVLAFLGGFWVRGDASGSAALFRFFPLPHSLFPPPRPNTFRPSCFRRRCARNSPSQAAAGSTSLARSAVPP